QPIIVSDRNGIGGPAAGYSAGSVAVPDRVISDPEIISQLAECLAGARLGSLHAGPVVRVPSRVVLDFLGFGAIAGGGKGTCRSFCPEVDVVDLPLRANFNLIAPSDRRLDAAFLEVGVVVP